MSTALVPYGWVAPLDVAPAVSISELVAAFLAGRKKTTLETYRQSLEDFASFLNPARRHDAAEMLLARSHGEANLLALRYRAQMIERGLAASTINTRLAALRSLVKLAGTLGIVPWKLEVPSVRTKPYRDTRGPGSNGFRLLRSEAESRCDAKGRRDQAIVRLLHDLALRRAEVVALDVDDVDLAAGLISVVGKGKAEAEKHTLPRPTAVALAAWMEARGTEPGPLFVNFDRAGKGRRPNRWDRKAASWSTRRRSSCRWSLSRSSCALAAADRRPCCWRKTPCRGR
jgi:integrase/recombinase XerC